MPPTDEAVQLTADASVHYLSVHDLVWIHSVLAGEPVPFDYERLESCMAAQYGYGDSTDVEGQSRALLRRCLLARPFERSNRPFAAAAFLAFLAANGRELTLTDEELVSAIQRLEAGEEVDLPIGPAVRAAGSSIRGIVMQMCVERKSLLRGLDEGARR